MDNVTHTLVGLVAGDALLALRARRGRGRAPAVEDPQLSRATLLTSVLANNLPDLDFLYRGITPGKLGYLLHHRGHTHTLVATLPLGLICAGIGLSVLRRHGRRASRSEFWFLLGVALLGGWLHVAFDFANNYGVHPFWPFDNHWYYGDSIFIVEPWLMVVLAGVALGARRSALGRGLLWSLVALLLGVAWVSQLLGPVLSLALSLGSVCWLVGLRRAKPRQRWWGAALGLGLVGMSFVSARALVRTRMRRALESEPGMLLSLSSTPAPGNPFCWWLLAVERDGSDYLVRQALVSSWPRFWPVESCRWPSRGTTAPLAHAPIAEAAQAPGALRWGPEFRAPLAELEALVQNDCVARAFSRYARVPYWRTAGESSAVIGDLRFDRSPGLDFTDLELHAAQPCPRFVPPWQPPLSLLRD